MKRVILLVFTLLLLFLSQQNFAQQNSRMKDKNMGGSYPYTANYSSNFAIGNSANARMILDLWKDWDDNAFDRHNYFADTIVMYFPDGSMIRGKDSALAAAKRYRNTISSSVSTLDAWVPLKSVDRSENWVALWGNETDTYADGKKETRDVQEIWRINKDGKVDFMKQYMSKPTSQQ